MLLSQSRQPNTIAALDFCPNPGPGPGPVLLSAISHQPRSAIGARSPEITTMEDSQLETRRITAILPTDVHVAVRTACARRRISTSALVERALRALLIEAGELPADQGGGAP